MPSLKGMIDIVTCQVNNPHIHHPFLEYLVNSLSYFSDRESLIHRSENDQISNSIAIGHHVVPS